MKTIDGFCTKSKIKLRQGVIPVFLFLIALFVYFGVGTDWSFRPKWDLDYFNPLAQSFLRGRLDIPSPLVTYDLSLYQGKYYPYWGPLPALLLIPLQIIKGAFIPTQYLNIFFGSLSVLVVYFLLRRVKKEFLPGFSPFWILLVTLFFAFGTSQFYLSTLSGVWHTAQAVSFLPSALGVFIIFKRRRRIKEYFWSSLLISLGLFGRLSVFGLIAIPFVLWLWDYRKNRVKRSSLKALVVPFAIIFCLFGLYNYARFGNPLETGYRYVIYHPHFQEAIQKNGLFSLKNVPQNLWYMVFEVPALVWKKSPQLRFSLDGSSIFFLAPPLLTIFLASPKKKWPYLCSLWLALLLCLFPNLIIYTTGWMQFGYRYSLDFMIPLVLLSVFGIKGKPNILYFMGVVFSIWMQIIGITALR